MFSLDLPSPQADRDLLIAELWDAGCTGINELNDSAVRVFFDDEAGAQSASHRFGGTPQPADDTDWVSEAQRSLEPRNVGERFFLVPHWRDDPTPPGRFRIEVNNGLAFGTGKHETTRLCLELLEKLVQPGMTVVDIGTGTGILSEAATLLGAAHVYASDVDHGASEIARDHGVLAFTGSADAVGSGVADLLVANISPEAISGMRREVPRVLKPGGVAILSGLELHDEVPFIAAELHTDGNWKALVVRDFPA